MLYFLCCAQIFPLNIGFLWIFPIIVIPPQQLSPATPMVYSRATKHLPASDYSRSLYKGAKDPASERTGNAKLIPVGLCVAGLSGLHRADSIHFRYFYTWYIIFKACLAIPATLCGKDGVLMLASKDRSAQSGPLKSCVSP